MRRIAFNQAGKSVIHVGVLLALVAFATAAEAGENGGSCNAWRKICLSRTQGDEAFCGPKVEECRRTGCFTEGWKYGGQSHCGLK